MSLSKSFVKEAKSRFRPKKRTREEKDEEERFIFGSLIALNVFFIVTILYLTTYLPNPAVISRKFIDYIVIAITLAVFTRAFSSLFWSKILKYISYIILAALTLGLLYIIYIV